MAHPAKRLIALIIPFIFFSAGIFAQTYTIQFKTNSGGNLTNETYLYSSGNSTTCSQNYSNATTHQWRFIPVGSNQPGWYYIQNVANGRYIRSGNPGYGLGVYTNAGIDMVVSPGDQRTKWRIINPNWDYVGSVAGTSHKFKLTSFDSSGNETALFRGTGTQSGNPRTSRNYDINNSVVEIQLADPNAFVYNSDMELITTYNTVSGSGRSFPSRPPTTDTPDFSSPATGESDYFMAGYTRTQANSSTGARVIHSNYSSGNYPEDGLYFTRLKKGDALKMRLENAQLPQGTVIEITYWLRASSGTRTNVDNVARIIGTRDGQTTEIASNNISVGNIARNPNDPTEWYFVRANSNLGYDMGPNINITITNTMTEDDALLDIDDFQVIIKTKDSRTFEYKNGANTPQQVHESTQIIYTLPESAGQPEELYAITAGYPYYRWHKEEKTDLNAYKIGAEGWWDAGDNGLFFVGDPANGQHIRYITPADLNDYDTWTKPYIVTCDAANYTDYVDNVSGQTFTEPSLSFRNHFEFRPAWYIAKQINDSLNNGSVLEYYDIEAPTNIRLRITPEFNIYNYWLSEETTKDDIIGNEAQSTTFSWFAAGSADDSSNPNWATNSNAQHNDQPITAGDIYSFPNASVQKHLQINTNNKTAGSSEFFDAYATNVEDGTTRKIARFRITYVDKNASGPLSPESGDLLSSISNKNLITKRDFDQIGTDPSNPKGYTQHSMGAKPLGLTETTYGFMNPNHYSSSGGTLTGGTHYANMCGYYSEYSFPQTVNVGQTAGYQWSTAASVYDRTYITTGTMGNMMYIDAAETPGIFATLDFEGDMCSGTELYFSAWIVNLNDISATDPNEEEMIRPNLVFMLADYTNENNPRIIKRFYTGDIGLSAAGIWRQIAFRFRIPDDLSEEGERKFKLIIQNNGANTTSGNDFAIDEICVYRSNPSVAISRKSQTYCDVNQGVTLALTIDIDKIPGIGLGSGQSSVLYYRFFDANNDKFANISELYIDQGTIGDLATTGYAYGSIDLNKIGQPGYENIALNENILTFEQTIPPAILSGSPEGSYTIWIAESSAALENATCSGEASFQIKQDETYFTVNIQGSDAVVEPADLYACTHNIIEVTAYPVNPITGELLYTFYDWYYGPIEDVTDLSEEEEENIEWDPTLNFKGFNTQTYHFEAYEGEAAGDFSVKADLEAYRYYYPYPTEAPDGEVECWPATEPSMTPPACDAQVDRYGATSYIPSLQALNFLLHRIRYYTGNNIIYLHKRTIPLELNSMARYFLTAIPTDAAVKLDSNGKPVWTDEVPICSKAAQVLIQAKNWGTDIVFGEVTEEGRPAMQYFDIEDDNYTYTVRLPEKDAAQFVVPMLYMDEIRLIKIELMEVDNVPVASGSDGIKVNNPYIGVIDPANPNKIDRTHTITANRRYDNSAAGNYVETEQYSLRTAWDLDDERGATRVLESYPLTYNAYNYIITDPYPDHALVLEGDPYPQGTVINGQTLTNNKIAFEIPAAGIPDTYTTDGKFKTGSEYLFRFYCTAQPVWGATGSVCDKDFYVKMKVTPDVVYWSGKNGNNSWNQDENWSADREGNTSAFAPIHATHVIIPAGKTLYPALPEIDIKTVMEDNEPKKVVTINETPATPYIQFDYNYNPNTTSKIEFETGSQIGNSFHLQYDTAKVNLDVNTMQWYCLSAPLRNMYSGDYAFERTNPLAQLRYHDTENPEAGATTSMWTRPLPATITSLEAGTGYSVSVGSLYYTQFKENPDEGAIASSRSTIDKATFTFPKTNTVYKFYNEITKRLMEKEETIPTGGRDFTGRFIYEVTQDGKSVAPDGDVLFTSPTNRTEAGQHIVVGNPFMSAFDFAEFYKVNKDIIIPEYKIQVNGSSFVTLSGEDDGSGNIINTQTTDAGLTLQSIAPMQSFIVTTKAGYTGTPTHLQVTKPMSVVNTASPMLRTARIDAPDGLRIQVNKDNYSTQAIVKFEENADDKYLLGEDSRRMLIKDVATAPAIYTIVDGMYLDVNRMKEMPESLPVGISTSNTGRTQITISGVSAFSNWHLYLKDVEEKKLELIEDDDFEYWFDNNDGDLIGRFYIVSQEKSNISTPDKNETGQESISVYVRHNTLYILSTNGCEINDLSIYGIDGRLLQEQHNIGKPYLEVDIKDFPSMLIVKANTKETHIITKILNK